MDFDDIDGRFIQVLIVVVVVFVGIVRYFYGIFVKPFVPPGAPGLPGSPPVRRPPRQHDIKDFLEELRRDLGHGEAPPPRQADGLMDVEKPEAGYFASERRVREEEAARSAATQLARRTLPQKGPAPHRAEYHPTEEPPVSPLYREQVMEVEEVTGVEKVARVERVALPETTGRVEPALARQRQGSRRQTGPAAEIPHDSLTAAGEIGSHSQIGAGEASGDSILGVDLERAMILKEVFGPAGCRRRGFSPALRPKPGSK